MYVWALRSARSFQQQIASEVPPLVVLITPRRIVQPLQPAGLRAPSGRNGRPTTAGLYRPGAPQGPPP
ncbi:hypothetical protein NHX12_005494 [Muraenolepis orangiensis]|uniref:Uncharacterized protein n=1 Tax=Muraenolepis orangiensis TaxID=630683 RepID=A0A9Q0ID02_9TELE|nr:hypothetical protein NHX12_005494 [Muraenolepis orangiensis]